eukprot:TRINITY_DN2350_c0_g1_i1.p1 TRINITY_DN2350_c0_g1~~TRINITY_DN2350_c0_g1_i1.p1  ORF type:complete len:320 (-),score=53.34 TRINITY_DN2350_c0_g1_i1:214-1113(-)
MHAPAPRSVVARHQAAACLTLLCLAPSQSQPKRIPAPAPPNPPLSSARAVSSNYSIGLQFKGTGLRISQASQRQSIGTLQVMASAPVEVIVKATAGQPDKLGDCPFSQRVLLTLEEKGVPYELKLVDTANKPQWFLDANPEGKVPVLKHEGKWVADSDVITQLLEEVYPEPSLVPPEGSQSVGGKLFPAFVKFLKSSDASDRTLAALEDELQALEDHLKATGGLYLGGEQVSSVDLSLAPKLYHLRITTKKFKNWTIPDKYTHVINYIKALESRNSFKKTDPGEESVISGWSQALGLSP